MMVPGVNGSILPAVPMSKRGQSFPRVNAGSGKLRKAAISKMPNGGGVDVADQLLNMASYIPGPTGMYASGLGFGYDLLQGDYIGAGGNLLNIATGGTSKALMAGARYAANAGARNAAIAMARGSHQLNRASNTVRKVTEPYETIRNTFSPTHYQSTQFGGYQDNTRIVNPIRKMPNGGLYPVGDYDKTLAPKEGNYLLPDINRPSYIDSEGSRRSEYKMGVNINGKETLIPTVVNGKQLIEEEAVARHMKTGLHMGKFDTPEQSEYEARLRTARYNMLQDPVRFTASQFKNGGEMIKRKDGSYSRRGLWDNIRANRGSGKKPTKQMLQQEKKIKSMQNGGSLYKAYLDKK